MAKHHDKQDGARGRRKKTPIDIFKEGAELSEESRVFSGTKPIAKTKASLDSKSLEVEVADISKELPLEVAEAAQKLVSSLGDKREDTKLSRSNKRPKKMEIEPHDNLDPATRMEVDRIWDKFSEGKIDASYAIVGETMIGQFIVDYDLLVETLVSYGFTITPVLEFIDEYNDRLKSGEIDGPLVMITAYKRRIHENVKPLNN